MTIAAQPGDVIDGRFEILRLLGRGAMADVYSVMDRTSGAPFAMKILRRSMTSDAAMVKRFQREARVQQMLDHPNIVKVYGSGMTGSSQPYLVMQLLEGRSLRNVTKGEGRVTVIRAASYIWQALQGLQSAHAQGVMHRDLKPANLMLEPSVGPVEKVMLIDFGFAFLDGGTKITQKGEVVGSLSYIAPERLRGQTTDERADLYSLGIVLYELLIGRRPFVEKNDYQLIAAHVEKQPMPLRIAAPDANIPLALDMLVMKVLSKDPGKRHQTAAEMATDLEAAAQHY
jgi:serine/threonine-protein kinase